jgi:hypothetical protein
MSLPHALVLVFINARLAGVSHLGASWFFFSRKLEPAQTSLCLSLVRYTVERFHTFMSPEVFPFFSETTALSGKLNAKNTAGDKRSLEKKWFNWGMHRAHIARALQHRSFYYSKLSTKKPRTELIIFFLLSVYHLLVLFVYKIDHIEL